MEFDPPPSFFFRAAGGCGSWPCRVVALWCPPLPVPVLGLLVSVPPSPFVCVPSMFFFQWPAISPLGCVLVCPGALSTGGLLLSAGCRRIWLSGPLVFFSGAPWVLSLVLTGWAVWPPLVELVHGLSEV